MADQPIPQGNPPQQVPVVAPDLSVGTGLIEDRPYQAPLPQQNIPLFSDPQTGAGGGPMTIAQFFNDSRTPSDTKRYLNPEYTPQSLTKRYSTWNPQIDNEQKAAENQSSFARFGNGLVKFGATALGTFAEGIMTIPDTIQALNDGKFSSLYQSDFEKSTDQWLKNLEDEFPNYYTQWEQRHPFLSALPFSGGFANFLSDKVIKNLGFTVGAIGGALTQDMIVGALTEGIGEIPLLGKQIGKASLWLNKVFSTETKLGEFLGATEPGLLTKLMETAKATPASKQALFDLKELAQMAATKKVTDATRYALNLYGAARTESGFEARDGYNTVKQDLIDQFRNEHNREPNDTEIAEMDKYATAGANVRFGINMALLTVSDAIQFDNILKPFSSARKGITGTLQQQLGKATIGLKEGTVDVFERKLPTTFRGKVWNAIKPTIPNILAEGVYEEGGQYAAQVATQNYYERKYYSDKGDVTKGTDKAKWSPATIENVMHSTMEGLTQEFGSTEGLENILLGGLTAVITGGIEHLYDKLKGHTSHEVNTVLSLLNNNSVTGLLSNMFGNAMKSGSVLSNMQQAVKNNDLFQYKNEQSHLFTNFVLAHLQADRFDVALEKLNIARDLPQGEFERAFGIDKSDTAKKTVSEYIDGLLQQAEQVKNNYEAINQVFKNPYKLNRKPKNKGEAIEAEKYQTFEEWKYSLLEHTSDIDDSNRRLKSIGESAQKIHPGITTSLLRGLTNEKYLKGIMKDYNDEADNIESNASQGILTSPEDKKRATALRQNAQLVSDFLAAKPEERDAKFAEAFESLLNFWLNNQDTSKEQEEVKKQNIPNLINSGVDANKIAARKVIAQKAYDILTSEKGFNRYFNNIDNARKTSSEIADDFRAAEVDTSNIPVSIKTKDGEISLSEGKVYTVNTSTEPDEVNAESLTYQGTDDNGDLHFTDSANEPVILPPSEISTLDKQIEATNNSFKTTLAEVGPGLPVSTETPTTDEDAKKDISFGPISTTDPRYNDSSDFNNHHRRHQEFLFNIGSTDPKVFDQDRKAKLFIYPVTEKTAAILGFPQEFTKKIAGEEDTIRGVYISTEDDEPVLLDKNGKVVQKLDGTPVDPNKIIFTTLPSTSLKYGNEERYTNKRDLNEEKVQEWHKAFREALLQKDKDNMPLYKFTISRGLPNVINQGSRNSVVEVGLVTKEDLNKLIITIPTIGDVVIAAMLNDEGEGIASSSTGVNMPTGVPLLNHGGNLIYLNNRTLTPKEASNTYDLLHELARRAQENKGKEEVLDKDILKYLSRILYFSQPQAGKAVSPNQVWVDTQGLHLGDYSVPFFTNSLQKNEKAIKEKLASMFHNVNNYELNRVNSEKTGLEFRELSVKDKELVITKTWPTYSHYLLTSENPPLATNIAKPQGDEIPIIQKYAVLQVKSFDTKAFESSTPKVKAPTPAIPGVVKKEQPKKEKAKEKMIYDVRHSMTNSEDLVSGVDNNPLTKEGIEKAEKLGDESLDKAVTQIIAPDTVRHQQTAQEVSKITGAEVKTFNALRPWDVGEWTHSKEEDFKKAEKFFAEHPDATEFEGKKIIQSFRNFVSTFLAGRLQIEKDEPAGTMVITSSKNLKVWEAYKKNGNKWDKNAVKIYLGEETPENAEVKEGEKRDEVIKQITQSNGKKIRYAQVFDGDNLVDIRIISGIDTEGKEVQLPEEVVQMAKKLISEALGLIAETPQPTQATTKTEVKEAADQVKSLKPDTELQIQAILESQKRVRGRTEDQKFYIIDGEHYQRVTSVIPNDFDGDTTKYENARIAGSTVDGIVRDFFASGSVSYRTPGISDKALNAIYDALKEVKKTIEERGERFITNNIVLFDTKAKIAGEVDILAVDKDGNFSIYDIKTGKDFGKYDESYAGKLTKRENHTNQLSAYSNLLQNQLGIKPKNLGILPIEISYNDKGEILTAKKLKGISLTYNPEISEIIPLHEPEQKVEAKLPTSAPTVSKLIGHKGKPKDTQFKAANVLPGEYTPGNIQEEFKLAKTWLPDHVTFQEVQDLIHMTGGGKAWGAMKDAAIYVYKNALRGTTYHEAFELVWQNFLKPEQQLSLYQEFKEREGFFYTYNGEYKTFSAAQFKEAKEQMADEFMDYVQDGKQPIGIKQKTWFQKLVSFIKKIFLGNQGDINDLFKNITSGYYKNYPASQKNPGSIAYRNIKASEALIQDVLQGMTADLFSREFERDSAIVTQLEENPKQATASVYGRLFNSMQYFFTSDNPDATDTLQAIYADKAAPYVESEDWDKVALIDQEFRGVQSQWEFIQANWGEFVKEHQKYLRVFKVEFTVGDDGEIKMDSTSRRNLEDYESMTGQSDYARDVMTINARNAASEKVKLLFATIADREFVKGTVAETLDKLRSQAEGEKTRIKRENSQVRMPKLAPYAKFFNYVLHNVTNTNGIYDIYKKLVTMSNNARIKINANVDALVNRLTFKQGFSTLSIDQAKMILSLENALSKQKPDFVRQFVDSEGNIYFKTSIVNSRVDQVTEDWITQIKGSNAVKVTPDGNFIFNKSIKDIKDPIELLEKIGINIEKEDYNNLPPKDKTAFNNEVNALRTVLEENVGKKLPIFTTKQLGIDSRLGKLASIYVDKVIGDDTDSMHFNLDGELTANFVLGNYASTILNDANNSKTKAEFIAKNPQFNDIFHKDSILLNQVIFGEDGKFVSPINIAVAEGRESYEGTNKASSTLTKAERFVYEINNNLSGVFYTLLPADAKTEWAIYTGTYIKASEYFDKTTTNEATKKFMHIMWSNLQTEIALAKDFKTNPNRQGIVELNEKYQGRTKGSSLRFFADILDPQIAQNIHSQVVDGSSDLEATFSREAFDAAISKWIDTKAQAAVDYLSKEKIFGVSDQGNYKLNGVLTEFVSKYLEKGKYHTPAETINMMKFREMNYAINNIEMHKFFFGDPAQYSDEMKRIKSFLSGREWSHVDYANNYAGFNQFANGALNRIGDIQLSPEDPGYHNFKNHMNTITVHDVIAESSASKMLQKAIGDEAIAYEFINEADAQTWQHISSYREALLKAGGRWTQAMEDQFQWEMAYERQARFKNGSYKYSSMELERHDWALLKKEPNESVFFYITKPIHSGVQAVGDTAIMSLDKTSSAPIWYRMAEGRGLVGLYSAMQNKGTDYIRVKSAHKVGIQSKSFVSLYDENGIINTKGILEAAHEEIPFKYYGIQVDTSSKKESQTEGSQLRKQAVGDLMDAGVPVDYKGNDWEHLTENQKEKASPIYTLVKQHDQALSALTNKRYQNLLSKLGIRETEDGFEYDNLKNVSEFLLNEITRRELPNNISDAIEVDPENPRQFKIPLEALSNYQQVRNILWSTVEKTVIRPKVSGGMKIQLAATGWEKANRVVKQTVNGKTVYTSSELKFYSVGEDGKTQACEIMLPYWFGQKIRRGLEERGKSFANDKEFKDHIIEYLNKTQEGKRLLSGIGFRIPTQRDNSIESFIVKDFLPEQMGDVVILPSEITTKAGSDFDVDKLSIYLRNFYIGKKGYPKAVPFENIDTNDPEQLKWYYEKYMLEANRRYEQWFREKASREFIDKVFDVQSEDEEPEYVPSLEEFLLQSQGKSIWEMNSLEALENKYFDILTDIYSLPEKLKGLVSPNDASGLKSIAEKINRMKNPGYNDAKQPYGRILDSMWMMSERHKYLIGKKGVGIAAVAQTNLNVNQGSAVHVVTTFQPRLPHNTVTVNGQKFISLGGIRNQGGEEISKVNASFIDGYVDIAKGAWIIDLGANDDTAKDFLLQVKWGTDKYDVALFMNQPAIQMYINERASRKSVSQINEDVRVLGKRRLFELVGSRFKAGLNKTLLDKRKPARYTREQMESMIIKYGKGEALTKDEAILQMQMLSDYQEIDGLGWELFRFVQGYNWDTSRNNDPNLVYKKELQYQAARMSPVRSVDTLMKSSFIGEVRDKVLKIDAALRSITNTQVGESRQTLNAIANDLAERRGVNQEEFRKAMVKAELSLLDYVIHTTTMVAGRSMSEWVKSLLTGPNAVAVYVDAMKKSGDLNLTTNPFIANVRPNIDKREGFPSTLELVEKDHDAYTSNVLTDAMRELNDNHTVISIDDNKANNLSVSQIYKRLVLASLLQSGSKRSSISFTHLIPNEHLSALIKDSIQNIRADFETFYNSDIVYRANWGDETLVPTVSPTFYEDFGDPSRGQYVYEGYNSVKFNEILKGQGVSNPPKVLKLNPFEWGDKKVVKTIEYKRDLKTKQIIERTVKLFKRVDVGSQPVIFSRKEFVEADGKDRLFAYTAFKEINKWGDGPRVQEYYDNKVYSELATNPHVQEIDNDLIIYGALNTGYSSNLDESVALGIAEHYKNQVQAEDVTPPLEDKAPIVQEAIPVTPKKEIKFEEVNVDETKRAGKKDIFPIASSEGEVGEVEGYKVSFKSHPDLNLYVYKTDYGTWTLTDAKSGKSISSGDTIKQAVANGVELINKFIKTGKSSDALTSLGITRSEEGDVLKDKDNGCKK